MRVVGKSLARVDAPGKVSGTAVYAADFALPGMLCGRVLRSTLPHARILRLDVDRACALPGVRAVITAADVPDVRYGAAVKDETAFAKDKVRYVGQPVAAVAAATPEAAEAALAAIDVVYEPIPTVLDLAAALAPGAPLVHEVWESYTAIPILQRAGNVCNRARIVVGDVERGFEEADHVFEHRFRTSMVHQGYTEPRAAVASWDSSGRVGAEVRLGQAEAADGFAARHPRQPLLLLIFAAVLPDREHGQRALDRHEAAESGVAGLQLHAGQAVGDSSGARAAVSLQVHAEQAKLPDLGRHLLGKDAPLEPVVDARQHARAHEVADGVADQALLV